MPRYRFGEKLEKRAKKISPNNWKRAQRFLRRLEQNPPDHSLNFKPMEGHNRELWEMKAGGQFRFILRRVRDEEGDLFIVEDVGPHAIYDKYNQAR
jgi:mRNA-degrading endonuclease RelE of RelBE toxin-antitoxin system